MIAACPTCGARYRIDVAGRAADSDGGRTRNTASQRAQRSRAPSCGSFATSMR